MPFSSEYTERLALFKRYLRSRNVDFWLQPINDEFQGEYVPAYAQRLPWISGFEGSAGIGIIAADESKRSGLLVDGRYIVQASESMDTALWDVVNSGDVNISQWISENAKAGAVVASDAWLHTQASALRLQYALESQSIKIQFRRENLIDAVWHDKPLPPREHVIRYPELLAGQSTQEKMDAISHHLSASHLDALIITQPDSIAWLLNIRGNDIPYNPLLLSYAVLFASGGIILVTHLRDFSSEITQYFAANNVTYTSFLDFFSNANDAAYHRLRQLRVGADAALCPHALWLWAEEAKIELKPIDDFIQRMKAAKYPSEQAAMREAHIKDAVSIIEFMYSLDSQQLTGLSELDIVALLEKSRSADSAYLGPSFATIAGMASNGAVVHYRADESSNRVWKKGELLLLDSGGQYLEGTTDITRMISNEVTSSEIKDRYTRVLKGHIALASVRFPEGTSGRQLDALARKFLWEIGCDYDHGTGHGVGTYLCVHEGPQRISKRGSDVPLELGMVISNEPGYYKAGEYGIRIENLVMVVPTDKPKTLAFDTITLVPIDTSLIDCSLMTYNEILWLNAYHAHVLAVVMPRLRSDEARIWLQRKCAPFIQATLT